MKILIFLLLSLPLLCTADDFGFVRVTVLQRNPQHRTAVTLLLNGHPFVSFSHAQAGPITSPIPGNFLASGKSTPLTSSYRGLQVGCAFKYAVEYSRDQASWVSLGVYLAPSNAVNTVLPIGICNESVCSSNPSIQQAIEQTNAIREEQREAEERRKWKEATQTVKDWLDKSVQEERSKMNALLNQVQSSPPTDPSDTQVTNNVQSTANQIAQSSVSAEVSAPSPSVSADAQADAIIQKALDNGTVNVLLQKNEIERSFLSQCQSSGATVQYYCQYGSFGWTVAAAEAISIAISADPRGANQRWQDKFFKYGEEKRFESEVSKNAEMRFRIQNAIEMRRAKEVAVAAARLGANFTPIHEAIDFCEAVTGREFCVPSGRSLENRERYLAVMGLIIGNRMMWDQATANMKLAMFDGFENPEGLVRATEKIAQHSSELDAKGIGHIFFGDFEKTGNITTLSSGLHTDEALGNILSHWESEGSPLTFRDTPLDQFTVRAPDEAEILRYQDSNGVTLCQLPADRFSEGRIGRNVAYIEKNGVPFKLQGAKTLFPSSWDEEKILTALLSVKNNPAEVVGNLYKGTFEGVPIWVAVDNNVIVTGYPRVILK